MGYRLKVWPENFVTAKSNVPEAQQRDFLNHLKSMKYEGRMRKRGRFSGFYILYNSSFHPAVAPPRR